MSPKHPTTKDRAKQFLQKLFEQDDSEKPNPRPPTNPPSNSQHYNDRPPQLDSIPDLEQSLNALQLARPHDHGHNSDSRFVGGFAPGYPTRPPHNPPSPTPIPPLPRPPTQSIQPSMPGSNKLPRPPSMPLPETSHSAPQSLTMQMALRPPHEQNINGFLSPNAAARPTSTTGSVSISSPNLNLSHSQPSTPPTKPTRRRASSTSTPSTSTATTQQCAGITKAGKRCTRQVKNGPALSKAYDTIDSDVVERFCFQHTKELLVPSGFYARKNGEWVDFDYWIPHYLQQDTQVALRVEMEKARSQSDVHGYIYTFEIRDPHATDTVKLKVGRAVNLVKRIDQWGKQCGSKEQVLRGWHPGTVEADGDGGSLMKGRVKAGEKGAWCHKLERLVHLELADLATTAAYLDPAWPKLPTTTSVSAVNIVGTGQPCADCGAAHKEIFELKKVTRGRHKGKEWDDVVKPVIERWGLFVNTYV